MVNGKARTVIYRHNAFFTAGMCALLCLTIPAGANGNARVHVVRAGAAHGPIVNRISRGEGILPLAET